MRGVPVPREMHLKPERPIALRAFEVLPRVTATSTPSTRHCPRHPTNRNDPKTHLAEGAAQLVHHLALLGVETVLRGFEGAALVGELVERAE